MSSTFKLHNAMWPGVVGKAEGSDQPPISLARMLELTVETHVGDRKFDGVDLFLGAPHTDVEADDDAMRRLADDIAEKGLSVGSLVAPVWPDAGGGSAMGDESDRKRFLEAVEHACRWARFLREHGVRSYGVVRIDSADSPVHWAENPSENTKRIAETFREAGGIASEYGERLAAEGEICWAGMHSWRDMLDLLEAVDMPQRVGFQADLAHTYLYLLGCNAPEHALLQREYSEEQFWQAYRKMTDQLGPWTMDFHVAQSDGSVFGSGTHDKTGRHCPADDPNGKLDVAKCARHWLIGADGSRRTGIEHICWDGCMFPNTALESPATWDSVLKLMIEVQREATTA